MPANDGTGTGWNEASPANNDARRYSAQEHRDLRKGVRLRLEKEHTFDTTTLATGEGGEHKAGSAVMYLFSYPTFPTKRPDGVTDIDSDDAGRLAYATNAQKLFVWTGSTWQEQIIGFEQIPDGLFSADTASRAKFADGIWTQAKIADGFLTADAAGHAKMADGFLSADTAGQAKMANGFLSANAGGLAKMADLYFGAVAEARAKFADGFITAAKIAAGAVSNFAAGSYTGNGSGPSTLKSVVLGWRPDALIIIRAAGSGACGIALRADGNGRIYRSDGGGAVAGQIDSWDAGAGWTMKGNGTHYNATTETYFYIALAFPF